uniref:Transcriptional repressor p66-beta n=1 Tax=Lygus hesperus TaxID=30085 RepID=A0A0A9W397_LYGHE
MENMEVEEEAVVDLSVSGRRLSENRLLDNRSTNERPVESRNILETRTNNNNSVGWPPRRSLRPRAENRSYAESPDIIIVDEEPKTNGYSNGVDSDDDLPMPPLPLLKMVSEAELKKTQEKVRKLRDQLRNEEMTLVLLKKLRQSYQIKENVAVVAPCSTPSSLTTHSKPVTPRTTVKQQLSTPNVHHLLRTQPTPNQRGGGGGMAPVHVPPPPPVMPNRNLTTVMPPSIHPTPSSNAARASIPPANISRNISAISFPTDRKDQRHSPAPSITQQERIRMDESQTPAQRQAAAKLALRKQLEKTLLQIPPPKPPPPEMHFIPNPSNTEFIYLVGLEHVVDFITKDSRSPPPPEPFRCSQCSTNFTPVWKWEKGSIKAGKEPRVICEQCVTSNVKKALKAEHTNRLKTAFVKALQQEQEIEQRLAQGSPQPEPTPAPPPPPPIGKPPTPKPAPPGIPSPNRDHLAKLADTAKFNPHHAAAAIHQQFLRGLPQHQPLPAHMIPFSPLLYPYQLAMAQAAGGKGPVAAAAANIVELQRQAADIQRQYLLDMIPPSSTSRHSMNNWKT